ncbi:thioredoxin family protein [Elizabethkingia meningoseptica]|uniref:Thioredoxin family protein n=2 Tax=Elizabethkingia meningoseptica TaxID=238 RepID=A0A1V3TXL6_ELIME|nr:MULTISPECIES: thioredoxin family protein [Elizabethkingia]AQX12990.1 thioredoxin [Elizabethkingia meningoseptica]MBG0514521.1 thioredoxin family protein [Elizabethkingia meningoseptica]MCL1674579.1 thioredoxin family protein [Elizabethkingia meningoseptica]MCL1686222.1 thioredoxin family protein [Elizabethkingia meningoseptica]MDE5431045.1 thioredoxin family protein [Elizabethkingia meningoseptica]
MKLKKLILILSLGIFFSVSAQQENANKILDRALTQAKKEKKNVMLIFHASWCGWCKKMEKNLNSADVKPLIDKNYIVTYVSVQERGENIKKYENPDGQILMNKYQGESAGLPFWVILDNKGTALDNSFDKNKENIGCPASPEEVTEFKDKLQKTSSLTANQLQTVYDNFVQKKS